MNALARPRCSEIRDTSRFAATLALVVLWSATACGDELADPTRPATFASRVVVRAPAAARVTAILSSADRRVAVFDGHVVKVGDRIGGITVEAILSDGVRFRRGDQVEYARLPKAAVAVRRKIESEERKP